jgi:hypothetical protein
MKNPDNHTLIYTDAEISNYMAVIANNLSLPADKQQWFIYGGLDKDVTDAPPSTRSAASRSSTWAL